MGSPSIAGTQSAHGFKSTTDWIPAFAGTTGIGDVEKTVCIFPADCKECRRPGGGRDPARPYLKPTTGWIPAFAGMTGVVGISRKLLACCSPIEKNAVVPAPRMGSPSIAGTQSAHPLNNLIIQIVPIRVRTFNQIQFPQSLPFLDALLSRNRGRHRFMHFVPDQGVYMVRLGKPCNEVIFVLPHALNQVRRHANI